VSATFFWPAIKYELCIPDLEGGGFIFASLGAGVLTPGLSVGAAVMDDCNVPVREEGERVKNSVITITVITNTRL